MQSPSDWILALLKEYKCTTQNVPMFVSDWDTLNDRAEYPYQFIRKALDIDPEKTLAYSFSDEQEEIKNLIIAKFSGVQSLSTANLAVSVSATAAIYLSILALHRRGFKRYAILTPLYYSIVETLMELGMEIHYFDLTDENGFEIELTALETLLVEKRIEVLMFNDPVYCVGKKISNEVLEQLVSICNRNQCMPFLDNTLGGLDWAVNYPQITEPDKLVILSKANKYLMVDSLTKRLLVNGLKHAVIYANDDLIELVEDMASRVYGGFCFPQLQFMMELYQPANNVEVQYILNHNARLINDNFQLLTAFLSDQPYRLYSAQSGYFTMLAHKEHLCEAVDIKNQITTYLYHYNTFLLPPWYFNFSAKNHFGLRVNLLKDPSTYLSALGQCIREQVKLLH